MRKTIYLIIAITIVATALNWTDSCTELHTDKELFGQNLMYAEMYRHEDPDYGFVIRYPSFFVHQLDSLNDSKGYARFSYNDQWVTVVLESYMLPNPGQSVKSAADSLAQTLHATSTRCGKDYFILSGPQYENESLIKGYSFYSKFVSNYKFWFVYTMVYPDHYHDVLSRLFKEIDEWQIWEDPQLEFRQGESQTPKTVSE